MSALTSRLKVRRENGHSEDTYLRGDRSLFKSVLCLRPGKETERGSPGSQVSTLASVLKGRLALSSLTTLCGVRRPPTPPKNAYPIESPREDRQHNALRIMLGLRHELGGWCLN